MLKWCPKPLPAEDVVARGVRRSGRSFENGLTAGPTDSVEGPGQARTFEDDPRLTGRSSLWEMIGAREKETILTAVRQELNGEFEARERELRDRHQAELADARREFADRLEAWSLEFSAGSARDRQERAVQAAGLAVALAGKIIRDTGRIDQDMVVRTLETALYKAQDAHPLTAVLHPDDAEFLTGNPELMARLRIEKVVPDRRLEKGGCRVYGRSREWDATLTRQLETLTAIVEDTLAAGESELASGPGENDDPGLD